MIGFFITGTGTGVGKTHVTAALAARARTAKKRVFAFKPVETGCESQDGVLFGADQSMLCEAAGNWQTGPLRGCYRFPDPVAPAVAARRANTAIDLSEIARALKEGAARSDLTLVEGAGGWRVPLTDSSDMSDLARLCGLPVIVVGTATLGTINHTLLTIEAIEHSQCSIAAVVLSQRPTDDPHCGRSNAEAISQRWQGPLLIYRNVEAELDPVFVFHGKKFL